MEDYNNLLEEAKNLGIAELLRLAVKIKKEREKIEKLEQKTKDNIKNILVERKWNHFQDSKSKISVTLTNRKQEKVDKESLELLLSAEQYNKIVKSVNIPFMSIVTPQDRRRLSKYV